MGYHQDPKKLEEELKEEMAAIREGLGPEESQKLNEIRDNLGDYDLVKSYRSCLDTACAKVSHAAYERRTNPVYAVSGTYEKVRASACDEIRARILNNPVFQKA